MSPTDTALFERWTATRDADAFAELVARHSAMVYGTCKRVLGNSADAEDVAQECFIELARARATIRRSLGGWLHTTAVHRSLDRIKAERRRKRRELRFVEQNGTQTELAWNDIQTYIDEAIAALPDTLREPVVYRFLEGRTHEATARDLGVSVSTVRYRIRKALDRIRSYLKRRGIVVATGVLTAMMGIHLAEAAPAALTAALGKLAIATDVTRTATVMSPLAVAGGTVIMAKKVLIGLGTVAVLLLLAYSVSDRKETETVERPAEVALGPGEPSGIGLLTVDETPPPPVDEPAPVNETVLTEKTQPVAKAKPIQFASVSGLVTDEQGYAFPGATVDFHITSDPYGGEEITKTFSTQSGPDGTYLIGEIDRFGDARMCASVRGFLMEFPFFRVLHITEGEKLEGVNLALQECASFVGGRVVSEQYEPVPGAAVNLLHYGYEVDQLRGGGSGPISDGGRLTFVLTDENGQFEITIPNEGLCDFTVTKEGYGRGYFPRVTADTRDAVFVLRSPGAITGKVTWHDGDPIERAEVQAVGRVYRGGLELAVAKYRHDTLAVLTDEQGVYAIEGLSEDYEYEMVAWKPVEASAEGNEERELRLERRERSPVGIRTVHVRAGRTTADVDFVLKPAARIYGTVTAVDTGRPVHPVEVTAIPESAEVDARGRYDDEDVWTTVTEEDGTYNLTVDVHERTGFHMSWRYRNFAFGAGGYDVDDGAVDIKPGEKRQFDFTVIAPVTVPVRFVYPNGTPRTDVLAGIRRNPSSGMGQSGGAEVDAEGRVMLRGLPPGKPYQVIGWTERQVVGVSELFVGKSGETLPELTVVCPRHGGIEGVLTDEEATPLADSELMCIGVFRDGTASQMRREDANAYGRFTLFKALPEGEYSQVYIAYRHDEHLYLAVVDNVEIVRDSVTTLGEIAGEPVSEERGQELFGGSIQYLR